MKKSPLKRRTPFKKRSVRAYKPRRATKRSEGASFLKKKLDGVFSQYIRLRDKGVCFTCGVVKPWKEQQNGHYISRAHNSLRFDERNCHCQCVSCNVFRHGNMDVYALRLLETYGNGILEELNREKQKIKQFTPQELKDLIAYYQQKIETYLL